jgi:hypothetical protein
MPLSDRSKHLLHEIYGVPYAQTTTVVTGLGAAPSASYFDFRTGVKEQLEKAIGAIDASDSMAARIDEILEEYENWALDYSTIDREGYSMRPERNERRVRQALYPYTGILFSNGSNGSSNKIKLG